MSGRNKLRREKPHSSRFENVKCEDDNDMRRATVSGAVEGYINPSSTNEDGNPEISSRISNCSARSSFDNISSTLGIAIDYEETLLEKSERFRIFYPSRYAELLERRKIQREKDSGYFRPDPRSNELNARLMKDAEIAAIQKERRSNMPPLLHVRVQCFEIPENQEASKLTTRRISIGKFNSVDSEENISLYEYRDEEDLKPFANLRRQQIKACRNKVELRFIVVAASNLHKWAKDASDVKPKARLTCAMQPDCEIYGPELTTRYAKPNWENVTRWGHIFIFQGFSLGVIAEKMITFTIDEQTNAGKKKVGYVNLSTRGCILGKVDNDDEQFCTSDRSFWRQFLLDPREDLDVYLPLYPSELVRRNSPEISLVQRLATLKYRSTASVKSKFKMAKSHEDVREDAVGVKLDEATCSSKQQ